MGRTGPIHLVVMTRMSSGEFEIARPSGVCAASGEPIEPGDRFIAAIVEREGGEGQYERRDYCVGAWEGGARPDGVFGFWRGVMPEPNAKPRQFIDDEALLDLFDQLGESEEEKQVAFRYLLALILMRKRLLRHAGSRRHAASGQDVILVRARGSDPDAPPIEVRDPGMDEESVLAASEQLDRVLWGEA